MLHLQVLLIQLQLLLQLLQFQLLQCQLLMQLELCLRASWLLLLERSSTSK